MTKLKEKILDFFGWYLGTLHSFSREFAIGRTKGLFYLLPILYLTSIINFIFGFGYFDINPFYITIPIIILLLYLTNNENLNKSFWEKAIKQSEYEFSLFERLIFNLILFGSLGIFISSIVFTKV